MKNEIQIINVPAGSDVSLVLNGEGAKQIANAPGGKIEFIYLDATDKIPLDRLRFDTSKYNLFVINDSFSTNGTFTVSEDQWLNNSKHLIPQGLTRDKLLEFTKYPALLVRVNEKHKIAKNGATAALCMVFEPEITNDKKAIKFKYIISRIFMAQDLNTNAYNFGILSSEQSNELDHGCWEIKEKDIIKLLGLEGEING